MKLLHPAATRCAPYSDGPWCFAYDPAHLQTLKQLKAHDVLLGFASGSDADRRRERLAAEGLVLACELDRDQVVADVLVGKKLTAAQKRKAKWMKPQQGFLSIPSGRLRIESLNCLSFGPDEPDGEGCELAAPRGDYDVTLHRVAWDQLEVESLDQRPELPVVLMELTPVGKKGPRARAALLRLAGTLGEAGAWMTRGAIRDGAFHGTTRAHQYNPSIIHLNLRGAHAEELGLRFGRTLELVSGDLSLRAPYTGHLTRRGMKAYLGAEWYQQHLAKAAMISGMSPFQGGDPWLLDVEGSTLSPDAPVIARVGEPWCAMPPDVRGQWKVEKGSVTGRVAWVAPGSLILNFGPDELRAAKISLKAAMRLAVGGAERPVYLEAAGKDAPEQTLLAKSMTYWDDPEVMYLWLRPLRGDRHGIAVTPGTEATIRITSR